MGGRSRLRIPVVNEPAGAFTHPHAKHSDFAGRSADSVVTVAAGDPERTACTNEKARHGQGATEASAGQVDAAAYGGECGECGECGGICECGEFTMEGSCQLVLAAVTHLLERAMYRDAREALDPTVVSGGVTGGSEHDCRGGEKARGDTERPEHARPDPSMRAPNDVRSREQVTKRVQVVG